MDFNAIVEVFKESSLRVLTAMSLLMLVMPAKAYLDATEVRTNTESVSKAQPEPIVANANPTTTHLDVSIRPIAFRVMDLDNNVTLSITTPGCVDATKNCTNPHTLAALKCVNLQGGA